MLLSTIRQSARLCAKAPACRQVRNLVAPSARQVSTSCASADAVATAEDVPVAEPLPTGDLDIRVGKILSVEKHPDADSLYVESIDVGEEEPRTIVSGLVAFVPEAEMADRDVIVICNLKARNMRGVKSHGMVLCASDEAHENVEPLAPPQGASVGERVWFEENQPEPAKENRVQKKKLWEAVQPDLKTTDDLTATYKGTPMMTSAGAVSTASLKGANIS
eukprot:jgi/Ulvmu1/5951/UM026_0073.1